MKIETSLLDERGKGGNQVGVADAIMEIQEKIDPKFVGGFDKRLKGIPSRDALRGACLQTHVSFADPLSGPQLSRIEMPRKSRDGKAPSVRTLVERAYVLCAHLTGRSRCSARRGA